MRGGQNKTVSSCRALRLRYGLRMLTCSHTTAVCSPFFSRSRFVIYLYTSVPSFCSGYQAPVEQRGKILSPMYCACLDGLDQVTAYYILRILALSAKVFDSMLYVRTVCPYAYSLFICSLTYTVRTPRDSQVTSTAGTFPYSLQYTFAQLTRSLITTVV